MPCDYSKYPKEWRQIREWILARAKDRCEFCRAINYEPHPDTGSKVVLTIAHLDHDTMNNDPENLRALCQRCHNRYDAAYRTANRSRTFDEKRGQMRLPPIEKPYEETEEYASMLKRIEEYRKGDADDDGKTV